MVVIPARSCILLAPSCLCTRVFYFIFILEKKVGTYGKSYFFIDGFNLYHSIAREKHLNKYKWIDLSELAKNFISKKEPVLTLQFIYSNWPFKIDSTKRISFQQIAI